MHLPGQGVSERRKTAQAFGNQQVDDQKQERNSGYSVLHRAYIAGITYLIGQVLSAYEKVRTGY